MTSYYDRISCCAWFSGFSIVAAQADGSHVVPGVERTSILPTVRPGRTPVYRKVITMSVIYLQ